MHNQLSTSLAGGCVRRPWLVYICLYVSFMAKLYTVLSFKGLRVAHRLSTLLFEHRDCEIHTLRCIYRTDGHNATTPGTRRAPIPSLLTYAVENIK